MYIYRSIDLLHPCTAALEGPRQRPEGPRPQGPRGRGAFLTGNTTIVHVYVCVCIYIYIYIYMYIYIYIAICYHIYMYMYVFIYIYIHTYMYIYTHYLFMFLCFVQYILFGQGRAIHRPRACQPPEQRAVRGPTSK